MDVVEKHSELYHYTTEAGLYGILETQTLHATHYKYLNDTSELTIMIDKLKLVIGPAIKEVYYELASKSQKTAEQIEQSGGIDKLYINDTNAIVNTLWRVSLGITGPYKFFLPFIVSFCSHTIDYEKKNGLLSQWRAYGRDSGYAIVFKTKELCDLLKMETDTFFYNHGGLGDVIYDGEDELFSEDFSELIAVFKRVAPGYLKGGYQSLEELFGPFVGAITRYKHRAFIEEKEVRLFLSPQDHLILASLKSETPPKIKADDPRILKKIRFKPNLTPHIAVFERTNERLPISQIIVGPHRDKDLRHEKLKRYVELKGLPIEIACSETPLV